MSELKKLRKMADKIYNKMNSMQQLSDSELKGKTDEFKMRLKNGETLEQIMPDAYAAVGEAAFRTTGLRPYKVQIMGAIAMNEGKIAELATGEGKAIPLDTIMPTPDGYRKAGDIKVGDKLFGRDGRPTKVKGVYPQGKKQIYEVHFADGRSVKTADEHLWSVFVDESNELITTSTAEMMKDGIRDGDRFRFSVPLNEPVRYSEANVPVNPYALGALIGKGYIKDNTLMLESKTRGIPYEVGYNIDAFPERKNGDAWSFSSMEDMEDMIRYLKQILTKERFIPEEYKTASKKQRWRMLQGLFDTCCVNLEDKHEFVTESKQLALDVREVIFSLGMTCIWNTIHKNGEKDKYVIIPDIDTNEERKPQTDKYRPWINEGEAGVMKDKLASCEGQNSCPKSDAQYLEETRNINDFFRCSVVSDPSVKHIKNRVEVTAIEIHNEETEMVCFTVDSPDHLFLCNDYIVTHNTLVAAMPAYLNALEEKGVHVVTVNDYLAARDAKDIGRIHEFMGLTVGCVLKETSPIEKKKEYAKDITYITNTELGFDYLRDNMAQRMEDKVQRGHHFCIIDEVDSVLIDEARTPLIISGVSGKSTKLYTACNELVKQLEKGEKKELSKVDLLAGEREEETGDYTVDEEHRIVTLTLQGIKKCEEFFGIDNLSDKSHTELYHNILAALKAHNLMKKDKDYVVKNGEVLIVDSFTGRIQPGRRYSDGIHQAIEAKEGVEIKEETSTYATITYQNFFNKYDKKCGMTGTAYTEKKEFKEIYHMDVVKIPTNKPKIREDDTDRMYLTRNAKFKAVVDEIKKTHETGQPILVGTSTIKDSEILDKMLKEEGLEHTVLNAKFLEKEADIISHAGEYGSITIATNMAGRGTDIKLDDKARNAGGLKVIGTQRHESRRIDNQLKGRSGRQGDPGESVFFLSLDDEVLRLYGSDRMKNALVMTGVGAEDSIENRTVNKFVRKAQNVIEDNNLGARKNVLKFDTVNNEQRELIYSERDAILEKADTRNTVLSMIEDSINMIIDKYAPKKHVTNEEYQEIRKEIDMLIFGIKHPEYSPNMTKKKLSEEYIEAANNRYCDREREWPDINTFRELERQIILRCIDIKWMQHINDLEILRQNISLVGYGQKDPAVVYKLKAFDMFNKMSDDIKNDVVYTLFSTRLKTASPRKTA